jgi:RNAse (barnase) inhibitor barstar
MVAPICAEINLAAISTPKQLHGLLAQSFEFPSYYGANWDAFWDCVRDPEQSKLPPKIIFRGWAQFAERFPRDAKILRECLNDLKNRRPDCEVVVG